MGGVRGQSGRVRKKARNKYEFHMRFKALRLN